MGILIHEAEFSGHWRSGDHTSHDKSGTYQHATDSITRIVDDLLEARDATM